MDFYMIKKGLIILLGQNSVKIEKIFRDWLKTCYLEIKLNISGRKRIHGKKRKEKHIRVSMK